ncbi:hypothetical protein BASA62_008425 [Batrachochytrium salamandrivorans]|nr:hypothetical protein BASA62_008425 [Batrachochytrium salamandrivorans]
MLGMLPKDYTIRPLQLDDYDRGYLETLAELTTVGNITKDQFRERFEWLQRRNEEYMCIVLYEHQTDRIVGSGNILIERKFIHGCSSVGHIEDIVVSESLRGKGLGQWIIKQLTHIGTSMGAYKKSPWLFITSRALILHFANIRKLAHTLSMTT